MTTSAARASALTRLTLVQASEAVRKGEVTSVGLTQAALDAFAAGDRTINASIALDRKRRWRRPRGSTGCARPGGCWAAARRAARAQGHVLPGG